MALGTTDDRWVNPWENYSWILSDQWWYNQGAIKIKLPKTHTVRIMYKKHYAEGNRLTIKGITLFFEK